MSDLSMLINGLAVTRPRRAPPSSAATRWTAAWPRARRPPARPTRWLAVEAAAEAFKTWADTGPGERRALLLKAADALEAKTPKFIEAVPAETGATGMWAGFNVMLAAGMLREAAALTTQVRRGDPVGRARLAWPWACASPPAWCWASRRGTRRSSWACAPSPRRWPAATPWC
jgi:hypothetical protein